MSTFTTPHIPQLRPLHPDQSPPGTTPPTPLDPDTAAQLRALVERDADTLHNADAATILQWANNHIEGTVAVTLSMENTVLAELAEQHLDRADLIFLDTGYHFPETYDVADQVEQRYTHPLIRLTPQLTPSEQRLRYGQTLLETNPTACCRMRKVEPLKQGLAPYHAWVTGLRRADSPHRAHTPSLSIDDTGRIKINPIVTWTLEHTRAYEEQHNLIIHPLTRAGYPSIGCAPCTRAIKDNEDPRAGRWAGRNKTECGLHP